MARTQDQINGQLIRSSPYFLTNNTIGLALLSGLAAAIRLGELLVDEVISWLSRDTAPEVWLDELGATRGLKREPWESPDEFRLRCFIAARGPTPDYIKSELNRVIQPKGYLIEVSEPSLLFCDLDETVTYGLFVDDLIGLIYERDELPLFAMAVSCPLVEVVDTGQHYVDLIELTDELSLMVDDPVEGSSTLLPMRDDLERSPYDRIVGVLDDLRPHGTHLTLFVSDKVQIAHIPNLFKTTSGYFF